MICVKVVFCTTSALVTGRHFIDFVAFVGASYCAFLFFTLPLATKELPADKGKETEED